MYVNPLERAYVAIVYRRWLNKTFYMPFFLNVLNRINLFWG